MRGGENQGGSSRDICLLLPPLLSIWNGNVLTSSKIRARSSTIFFSDLILSWITRSSREIMFIDLANLLTGV